MLRYVVMLRGDLDHGSTNLIYEVYEPHRQIRFICSIELCFQKLYCFVNVL